MYVVTSFPSVKQSPLVPKPKQSAELVVAIVTLDWLAPLVCLLVLVGAYRFF